METEATSAGPPARRAARGTAPGATRGAGAVLRALLLAILLPVAVAPGCASGTTVLEPDPWQGFNRSLWGFNMWLDDNALEPMGRGWDVITSDGVQQSVANFGEHWRFPKRFLNNIFQLKPLGTVVELGRFVINTTVGLLGFFDPAGAWGMEPSNEDFGQTFAWWGSNSGSYLVLPIAGPSNPRDAVGGLLDALTSVTSFPPLYLIDAVNWRAMNLERIATNKENALDFYVFVRNAYEQRRDDLIHDFREQRDDAAEDDLYFLDEDESAE